MIKEPKDLQKYIGQYLDHQHLDPNKLITDDMEELIEQVLNNFIEFAQTKQ